MTRVTVLLPVHRRDPHLRGAVESILQQTMDDLELLVIRSGGDEGAKAATDELIGIDRRLRVMSVPEPGLARALNAGLRAATTEFVARMDADDVSLPGRLEKQLEVMRERPELAALGTWYDVIGAAGERTAVRTLPTEPAEIRWRLMLANVFAHGSMMLRREPVLAAGGYDESIGRAQDYELWLRLSSRHELANVPEVLYRWRAAGGEPGGADEQSMNAAGWMLRAWDGLPGGAGARVTRACAMVIGGGDTERARAEIERELADRPSRGALQAWLWLLWFRGGESPAGNAIAEEAGRAAVLRECVRRLPAGARERLWLWPAGRQTHAVLPRLREMGMHIAGVVDDARAGDGCCGFVVREPAALRAGDVVIITSDVHAASIWERSAPLRERGVIVHRLYHTADGPIAAQIRGAA